MLTEEVARSKDALKREATGIALRSCRRNSHHADQKQSAVASSHCHVCSVRVAHHRNSHRWRASWLGRRPGASGHLIFARRPIPVDPSHAPRTLRAGHLFSSPAQARTLVFAPPPTPRRASRQRDRTEDKILTDALPRKPAFCLPVVAGARCARCLEDRTLSGRALSAIDARAAGVALGG